MARRRSSDSHQYGVVGRRKAGSRREKKGYLGLVAAPSAQRTGGRRPSALSKGRTKRSGGGRRSVVGFSLRLLARLAKWAVYKVQTKKWRRLTFAEAVIWLGASAVCIAFLVLLAKSSFLLAAAIFGFMVAYVWRQLDEK